MSRPQFAWRTKTHDRAGGPCLLGYDLQTRPDWSNSSKECAAYDVRPGQNYPNPFNPSTTTKYELPRASVVRLSVFDMLGAEVSVLVNEKRDAGVHEVKFDGSTLASGVYFYRLKAEDYVATNKLVLMK